MNLTTAREEMADESGWQVVYTKTRQEARALENLRNEGFDCLLPTLSVDRLRAGHRVAISESLFPRYLFGHLGAGRSNWSAIRSTRDVSHLVRFCGVAAMEILSRPQNQPVGRRCVHGGLARYYRRNMPVKGSESCVFGNDA